MLASMTEHTIERQGSCTSMTRSRCSISSTIPRTNPQLDSRTDPAAEGCPPMAPTRGTMPVSTKEVLSTETRSWSRPAAPISTSEAAWARACPVLKLERLPRCSAAPSQGRTIGGPSAFRLQKSTSRRGGGQVTDLQPNFEGFSFRRTRQELPQSLHHPARRQTRQNMQLQVKDEVEWGRDSLRSTSDQGVLLGGAYARSLDHSLVL